MNNVSIIKCADYDNKLVFDAVKSAVDLVGGINRFVTPGMRVALKVNLLMKSTPEKCATTHPAVVRAAALLVKNAGGIPFIVDSAGGPFTPGYINAIYKASGLEEIARELEIELNQNFDFVEVENPAGKIGFKFPLVKALEEADVIINLTKLKTHSFTGYTNCVKNMFGAIPGLSKVEMHGKYRDLTSFTNFIYDIHTYFGDKIVLNITDAIMGMEGDGPSNGTPKQIGLILAGTNALAVDFVACKIMTITPEQNPFIKIGIEREFCDINTINVVGATLDDVIVRDFKTVTPDEYKPYANYVPRFLQTTVHKLMTKRPVIKKSKCKGCKKCFEHCPAKAISMVPYKNNGVRAQIDYNKCIRCYCCQELCPFGVVKIKSGVVYKLVHMKKNKQ